ncbi:MAG TPA: hypothetical protein VF530_16770 [Planctomycetota bacterium]
MLRWPKISSTMLVLGLGLAGCGSGDTGSLTQPLTSSCMLCHNGAAIEDYSGPGLENPHPFPGADKIACTTCHGGNPNGADKLASHVPPPPEIGDRDFQDVNARAWFNRLTLAGIDKFPDYFAAGRNWSALDYLQFVNPGDLRVTSLGRSCGQCHANHAQDVQASLLATSAGILSGALYQIGAESATPEAAGLHQDTAVDYGVRAVSDPSPILTEVGSVARVLEYPVYSRFGVAGGVWNNLAQFSAAAVNDDQLVDGRVVTGSPLMQLYNEQISFTCGDCHLGSAGANNRAGDFRSSGCTACHMPYSLGGRSGSNDPNVSKLEPLDPDDIDDPERSHVRSHRIHGVARTLSNGTSVPPIDDLTCAGCHQGSNRTVMQYWGIRLDQNADVVNNRQYPANPVARQGTHADTRLFDPAVGNDTFNGRNGNQYLAFEDYDGDGRDDTPPDIHHEKGLGCIDCHGSFDLHGGDAAAPGTDISSRMEQQVAIRCESCHGTVDAYAPTVAGTAYDGTAQQLAVDAAGKPLRHVVRQSPGVFYLRSKLTGNLHYVPQTRDAVVNSGKTHPISGAVLYSAKASYAMGRVDADPSNGIGPVQTGGNTPGFSHGDRMDCASCHSAWTNTCMGCHLSGEYDTGNNFSNQTGERIVYKQRTADFTYQSPLFFQLGVTARGKISTFSANTKVMFQWEDQNNQLSRFFQFSDRHAAGNNPAAAAYPSLSHNAFMAHSIRGKVSATREGPRYCVACHLTDEGLATFGTQYDAFRNALASGSFGALDYNLLRQHFGRNPGNQLGSPFFAHMAAGLGTGLFLFDANGAPVNPLDTFAGRKGAGGVAPSTIFDPLRVTLNLDRIVEPSGVANGSNNHTWAGNGAAGAALRDGALDPNLAGPLGATLIRRLADPLNGIVLDSWLDANGAPQGDADSYVGP